MTTDAGTIRITARTLDLAREALADWLAEHPNRVLDSVAVTGTIIPRTPRRSARSAARQSPPPGHPANPPRPPHDWRAPPASRCKRRQGLLGSR